MLVRQIDNRNVNRTICPNSYQQFSRQISPPKLLRPIHDHQEHDHRQQHHYIRSDHTSTTHHHQQQVAATQRRLTRIPMNSTIDERLQSRTSTATDWQQSSSIDD